MSVKVHVTVPVPPTLVLPNSRPAGPVRWKLWSSAVSRISKSFVAPPNLRFEIRLDMFNALNHTQFTGVNATANFANLTDRSITNLPADATGNIVRQTGFGSINGVDRPRSFQLVTRVTF